MKARISEIKKVRGFWTAVITDDKEFTARIMIPEANPKSTEQEARKLAQLDIDETLNL